MSGPVAAVCACVVGLLGVLVGFAIGGGGPASVRAPSCICSCTQTSPIPIVLPAATSAP